MAPNRNEREGIWRLGMGRQRGKEKKNKFTLGTGRYEKNQESVQK